MSRPGSVKTPRAEQLATVPKTAQNCAKTRARLQYSRGFLTLPSGRLQPGFHAVAIQAVADRMVRLLDTTYNMAGLAGSTG